MRSAMITVEILISLVILFLVIATSSLAVKHLFFVGQQQKNQEAFYTAILNIRDLVDTTLCRETMERVGSFSDFRYRARCTLLSSTRNYIEDYEGENPVKGNVGPLEVRLYQVDLTVERGRIQREIHYLMTLLSRDNAVGEGR